MKFIRNQGFIVRVSFLILCFPLVVQTSAQTASLVDSASSLYLAGSRMYDSAKLKAAIRLLSDNPGDAPPSSRGLLIIGLASWRLTLIAFCNNDKKGTLAVGKKAVEALDRAEEEGADRYITSAHRALTYQLLAGLGGFKNGALYGKLSASALKKVTSEKPDGYFTRLIKAINTSQAPRFAGGNPEKAAELFSSLRKEYPDSTDLTVHLAETYRKLKKYKEARVLLKPVIDQRPSNLLARKTLNDIPRKK